MRYKRLQEIVKGYKQFYEFPPFKIIDKNCPDLLYYEYEKEEYIKLYDSDFIKKLIKWLKNDLDKLKFKQDYHKIDKSQEIKEINENINYLEKKLEEIKRKYELEEKLLEQLSDEEIENMSYDEIQKKLENMSK